MASLSEFKKQTASRKPKQTKLAFVKVPDEGEIIVQFLTEFPDIEFIVEHSKPGEWFKSTVCTYNDEGNCYACEQQHKDWNQKIKVFVGVLHDGKMKVLSQGMGANSVIHGLREYYVEHGTILDTQFTISRNGKGKRTKYIATPIDNSEVVLYNGDISLSELRKSMDYDAQAKYYK